MLKVGTRAQSNDDFLDELVLPASYDLIPWFIDFANYLESDLVPSDFSI